LAPNIVRITLNISVPLPVSAFATPNTAIPHTKAMRIKVPTLAALLIDIIVFLRVPEILINCHHIAQDIGY
jgi:hypothetical protein